MKNNNKKVFKLLFALLLIAVFIYSLNVFSGVLPIFHTAWEEIKYREIEAGGIYYTDTPEARDVGFFIKSYREYAKMRDENSDRTVE